LAAVSEVGGGFANTAIATTRGARTSKDLKGIAGPVRAWAALRASSAANSQLFHAVKMPETGTFSKKTGRLLRKDGQLP
jgi:hypothetical protein